MSEIAPILPTLAAGQFNNGQLWAPLKQDLKWFEKYLLLLKGHEQLLIVLLVLGFGAHMYGRWIDLSAARDKSQVTALVQTVQADKLQVSNLAQAAAIANDQYQKTLAATEAVNAHLSAANGQLVASLKQNQAVDAGLDTPALGARLVQLVPGAENGVTATSNGLALDATASHSVVATLETVPALQTELSNETQVAQNNANRADSAAKLIADQQAEISALQKKDVDDVAEGKAAVALEKTKTKKAFIRGFKWGFGVGFAAGAYITHGLGF